MLLLASRPTGGSQARTSMRSLPCPRWSAHCCWRAPSMIPKLSDTLRKAALKHLTPAGLSALASRQSTCERSILWSSYIRPHTMNDIAQIPWSPLVIVVTNSHIH